MMTSAFTIPNELHNWRFILLLPRTKIPTADMIGWDDNRAEKTFSYDSPKLIAHVERGGNYGVVTNTDRFVLAADTKEVEQAIEAKLPKTFTVRSPRHKTKHFYYFGHISEFVQFTPDGDGAPCCDLKFGNAFVLGAQSVFKDYGEYVVVDDLPIATITEAQVREALAEFIKQPKKTEASTVKDDKLCFQLSRIIDLSKLNQKAQMSTKEAIQSTTVHRRGTSASTSKTTLGTVSGITVEEERSNT